MAEVIEKDGKELPIDWEKRLVDLSLQPLWDSKLSLHTETGAPDDGNLWAWSDMRAMMIAAGEVSSPQVVQRRVIEMLDPRAHYSAGEGTIGTINACMQLLKPQESARPHRHSMNAIRFVLESTGGARTIVDGKPVPMERGDLVLTPGWCWHEHVHEGTEPIIWLDVLDLAIHRFLKTEAFEPGPVTNARRQLDDASFEMPNIVPVTEVWQQDYSPVFRYPWADAVRALHAAPRAEDGSRSVRYSNPMTGTSALPFLDMLLIEVETGQTHKIAKTRADMVICPVQGKGRTMVGNVTREWGVNDVLSVPLGRPLTLSNSGEESAIFFTVTNSPVFEKLNLLI